MSRVKVSPTSWRDEGPQSPYSPNVRLGGALVTPADAPPRTTSRREPTDHDRQVNVDYYYRNREQINIRRRERRAARRARLANAA